MPFIMISGAADQHNVHDARDAGANEFVAKPFTIGSVFGRIQAVIDRPRQFVATRNYFGPDRRRVKVEMDRAKFVFHRRAARLSRTVLTSVLLGPTPIPQAPPLVTFLFSLALSLEITIIAGINRKLMKLKNLKTNMCSLPTPSDNLLHFIHSSESNIMVGLLQLILIAETTLGTMIDANSKFVI